MLNQRLDKLDLSKLQGVTGCGGGGGGGAQSVTSGVSQSVTSGVSIEQFDGDIEITTHEWNAKLERSIQSLGELSLGYKWMHCEMAKDYSTVYNRLMYGSIALGPFVGVVNTINQTFADTTIIPLLITIFSFLTGVLAGIIKFCDYEEKVTNHMAAAARYTSLANNARIQLNLEKCDREDSKQYMVWYTTSYGNLFESSPILPDYVMVKWRANAIRHGFKIPGEVGILMDVDDSENMKDEVSELKRELSRKTSQIESMETIAKNVNTKKNKRVRLSMYNLGDQHHTDFNTNDLARFNNILMKRELKGNQDADDHMRSQRSGSQRSSSQQSSRQSTGRTEGDLDENEGFDGGLDENEGFDQV